MSSIRPLDFDELEPELRESLRPRYERLGYLGDFFRYAAHQPRALRAFDEFTEACKSALPQEIAEAVALTAATALGNDYERNQHERLAVRLALGRNWVRDIERLDPDGDGDLDETTRAVQRFVLASVDRDGSELPRALEALVDATDEATAIAVALLAGRFVAHALVTRACGIGPVVPSIFEDGFDGS